MHECWVQKKTMGKEKRTDVTQRELKKAQKVQRKKKSATRTIIQYQLWGPCETNGTCSRSSQESTTEKQGWFVLRWESVTVGLEIAGRVGGPAFEQSGVAER